MIAYEINPSSAGVVVTCVRDVRPISYDGNGSYVLPENLRIEYPSYRQCADGELKLVVSDKDPMNYYVRQLGLVPHGNIARIFLQPSSGYDPIKGKVILRSKWEELRGDYEKFPDLPRRREVFYRELVQDNEHVIERSLFDVIAANVGEYADERKLDRLMENTDFFMAINTDDV